MARTSFTSSSPASSSRGPWALRDVSFRIRPEAKFANGDAVTPADVVYSFVTLSGKGSSPTYQTALGGIAKVEAVDSRTVRFELRGIHRGKPLVIVEHVDRISLDAAPQWNRATTTEGTAYRVNVIGRPTFTCELGFSLAGGISGAVVSTATYLVNAIASAITSSASATVMPSALTVTAWNMNAGTRPSAAIVQRRPPSAPTR